MLRSQITSVGVLAVATAMGLLGCSPSSEDGSSSNSSAPAANQDKPSASGQRLGFYEDSSRLHPATAKPPSGSVSEFVPHYVFRLSTRWPLSTNGAIPTVCFAPSSTATRNRILSIAKEWSTYANVTFDAGQAGDLRTCGARDGSNIRIGFQTGKDGGYWSVVGNTPTPEPFTMNFEGFDTAPPEAVEFRTVVLHEFGHALGFEHEHQHPYGQCDAEFDWETVYAAFKAPPNNWDREKVDFNLRGLPPSTAYGLSAVDRKSIMHYTFYPWMFKNGANSTCYVAQTTEISELDRRGAAKYYPKNYTPAVARSEAEHIEKLAAALPAAEADAAREFMTSVATQLRSVK